MQGQLDIAIAGAGPGGLAAALYLHRAGHRVRMFERFETPQPVGSGLMLQPTGQAVLADLGLLDRVFELGTPIDGLLGHDARTGRVVLDVRYAALKSAGQGLGIHRATLFNVLHDAAVAEGIEINTGIAVSGRDGGRLVAGNRTTGSFDLIIDTMGASSPLRREALLGGASRMLPFGAIWGTTPWVDAGFERTRLMQRYRRSSVMIGVLPIGRHRLDGPELAAFFWSLPTDTHSALLARGLEAWKDEVRGHWPETEPHLGAVSDFAQMTLARYQHATLRVPAGHGIAFVGDSAHSTSPQLGQGANMALLDAKALALALAETGSVADALALYARLRRWHVRLYQWLSLTLTPFYQSDSRVLPVIRDLLVSVIGRVPPAPQILALMVAGKLLNPMNRLGLKSPALLEAA